MRQQLAQMKLLRDFQALCFGLVMLSPVGVEAFLSQIFDFKDDCDACRADCVVMGIAASGAYGGGVDFRGSSTGCDAECWCECSACKDCSTWKTVNPNAQCEGMTGSFANAANTLAAFTGQQTFGACCTKDRGVVLDFDKKAATQAGKLRASGASIPDQVQNMLAEEAPLAVTKLGNGKYAYRLKHDHITPLCAKEGVETETFWIGEDCGNNQIKWTHMITPNPTNPSKTAYQCNWPRAGKTQVWINEWLGGKFT